MPVPLKQITGGTKSCQVSYTPEGATQPVSFEIRYYPEAVTGSVFVRMLELQSLGTVLKEANEDPEGARKALESLIDGLAATLGSLVEWQDLVDDEGKNIAASADFFHNKKFEFQLAYVNAILSDKQRPTPGSNETSPNSSIPKESSDAALPATPLSEQPSTSG